MTTNVTPTCTSLQEWLAAQPDLYWDGGSFERRIYCKAVDQDHVTKALHEMDNFRNACQEQYMSLTCALRGGRYFREHLDPAYANAQFYVGTAKPEAEQSPGKSIVAQMQQGDLSDYLKDGGEHEDRQSKAMIVFIYHLWEELFRGRIAKALAVEKANVTCTLMADIRVVRNAIIHRGSVIRDTDIVKLTVLSRAWRPLQPGFLRLSRGMGHSLMEQVNALRVVASPARDTRAGEAR